MMDTDCPTTELLLEHQDWLRRIARRLVQDEASVDDLLQQVWLAALRTSPKLDRGVRGWLATVVRNAASNRARDDERRLRRERAVAPSESATDTADIVDQIHAQRDVVDAVLRLAEPYRTVILLRFFRELPPSEIASRLGTKVPTVKTQLRRGLAHLRDELDATRGGDRRSWCLALLPIAVRDAPVTAGTWISGSVLAMTGSKVMVAILMLATVLGVAWNLLSSPPNKASSSTASTMTAAADPTGPQHLAEESETPELQPRGEITRGEASADATPIGIAATAVVRITDDEGRLATEAQVVLESEGGVLTAVVTDERGELRADPTLEKVDLYIHWKGAPPAKESIVLAPGVQELRLPRGAVVGGRVWIDGAAPTSPITLQLASPRPFESGATFPVDVIARLNGWGVGPGQLTTTTNADGTFRFAGLPRDFRGDLLVPWSDFSPFEAIDDHPHWMAIPGPRDDYLIRLRKRPSLRGRALHSDGTPVVDASVFAHVYGPRGSFSRWLEADRDGNFEFSIRDATTERVEVRIIDDLGAEQKEVMFDGDFSAGRDVGDIYLDPSRLVRFQVVDAAGDPIEGAQAVSLPGPRPASEPTDVEGHGEYELTSADQEVCFTATGYDIASLPTSSIHDELVRVRLSSAARLEVTVVDEQGAGAGDTIVVLSADRPFLTDPELLLVWHGGPPGFSPEVRDGWWGDTGTSIRYLTDGGKVRISRIAPDVPIEVTVIDAMNRRLATTTVSLAAREERKIRLQVPSLGGALRGTVTDRDGNPLGNAWVLVSPDGERSQSAQTDPFGAFTAPAVRGETIRVLVRRGYFVPYVETNIHVPAAGLERHFVLQPATEVECLVTDTNGRPIDGAELRVSSNRVAREEMNLDLVSDTDERGRAELDSLPIGLITIEATIHDRIYAFEHDTTNPNAYLVVPPHGVVEFFLNRPFHASITDHRFRFQPIEERGLEFFDDTVSVNPEFRDIRHTTPAVLAGRYRVVLERLSDEDWETYLPVGVAEDVTVSPFGVTQVELHPVGDS